MKESGGCPKTDFLTAERRHAINYYFVDMHVVCFVFFLCFFGNLLFLLVSLLELYLIAFSGNKSILDR